MKYKIGEEVVFIKKSSKIDAWPLNDYEKYIITDSSFRITGQNQEPKFYGVKHKNGSESTWYDEIDFIKLKEYRKLKLEKINEEVI